MVRSASFDSNGMKKGAWSEDEDNKLRAFILTYGHSNWRLLPKYAGLKRCGKSCRLRWVNHLKPGVRRGNFGKEEEELIIKLHAQFGNKWSTIAAELPGRTDNDIKNFWHTRVARRRNPNSSATTQPPPPPPSSIDDAASLIKAEDSILTAFDHNNSTQPQIGSSWADHEFPADYAQNYAAFPPLLEEESYYPGYEDHSIMFDAVNGSVWDEAFASNASDYQLQNRACAPHEEGSYDPILFSLWNS